MKVTSSTVEESSPEHPVIAWMFHIEKAFITASRIERCANSNTALEPIAPFKLLFFERARRPLAKMLVRPVGRFTPVQRRTTIVSGNHSLLTNSWNIQEH
jgi:hypothetical protein